MVEAVQSGAKCLLIDEDTCATNFMVRDELMQAVVSGEQEPITPFTLQAGNLYQKQGISIILVAGSSGSYFYIADHVLQMDNYRTYDITEKVKTVIGEKSETREKKVPVDVAVLFDKDHHRSLKAGKMEKKRDQVKIKLFGKDSFSIGRERICWKKWNGRNRMLIFAWKSSGVRLRSRVWHPFAKEVIFLYQWHRSVNRIFMHV